MAGTLLDLKFERRVTPILVRWVYAFALVVIVFGTLFALLWIWSFAVWLGWAMWLAAPVVIGFGVASLLVVRIFCEYVISRTQPPPVPPGLVPAPPGYVPGPPPPVFRQP
ncbi:DUF4282 domain-containing protein [Actinomadura roseirufa]|uniref:DUF4282 domain-containing protein n=1 Tax=Actinomadura roseirufa TaxID=2094049 RepID=UPI0013F14F75|nr:DUF4282 domain-containing protein [Actinomadura roseirufa]